MAPEGKVSTVIFAALRCALAVLFLYAGIVKALHPIPFIVALENYRLFSKPASLAAAIYIPWVEILCGTALIFRNWRLAGWILSGILSSGFLFFVGSARWRGLDIACGCFGQGSRSDLNSWSVLWAMALVTLASVGTLHEFRLERESHQERAN